MIQRRLRGDVQRQGRSPLPPRLLMSYRVIPLRVALGRVIDCHRCTSPVTPVSEPDRESRPGEERQDQVINDRYKIGAHRFNGREKNHASSDSHRSDHSLERSISARTNGFRTAPAMTRSNERPNMRGDAACMGSTTSRRGVMVTGPRGETRRNTRGRPAHLA
jgi:hypothetical protein